MNQRTVDLLGVRPSIKKVKITAIIGSDEYFQTETLRPIIKFQNEILLLVFKNYIKKHKNRFYELSNENRLNYIETAIQRDIKFRNSLKGIVIGQFTSEEYDIYIQNSSSLNKRMMNLVIARLKDQLQYFEMESLV